MIIPVGYAQVNWIFQGLGAPRGAQVTFGVENVTSYDAAEMAEAMYTLYAGNILGFQSDQVSLVECRAKLGPNATGPEGSFLGDSIGGDTGDSDSPATAFLIHKHTPYGGRTGRGRMYLPGVAGSRVEPDGQVSSVVVTDLNTALASFLEEMHDQDLNAVVLHSASAPSDIGPRTITSLTVDARVATQRRRLR